MPRINSYLRSIFSALSLLFFSFLFSQFPASTWNSFIDLNTYLFNFDRQIFSSFTWLATSSILLLASTKTYHNRQKLFTFFLVHFHISTRKYFNGICMLKLARPSDGKHCRNNNAICCSISLRIQIEMLDIFFVDFPENTKNANKKLSK